LRKAIFGVVIGALVFAAAAWASQQNNSVTYSSTVKYKGKPTSKKPKNVLYTGILDVSAPDGTQPNTAPLTEVFFAKQLKNNAKKFPGCPQSQIDGKSSISSKCKKAQIGDGTANAMVGQPGSSSSIPQNLTVLAFNGVKGKQIMLALTGGALGGTYRVIPGPIKKLSGKFGYKVNFKVPKELQNILGSQIALTHFNVKIKTKKQVKIKGKKASYLQITSCPKSKKLPTKAIVHFNDDAGNPSSTTKTSNGVMACHR
jgi:hypothetical protein